MPVKASFVVLEKGSVLYEIKEVTKEAQLFKQELMDLILIFYKCFFDDQL